MPTERMRTLLVDPFFTGSHQAWAQGYQRFSHLRVRLATLPGRHWKWRMFGGAVNLAQQYAEEKWDPDLILATDMLDLTTFLALTRPHSARTPVALYFHENQITYPWSPTDDDPRLERNHQYGFLNYTSALAADAVLFNSHFHHTSFLEALPEFLRQYPDRRNMENIERIVLKSQVLPLGLDLRHFDDHYVTAEAGHPPVVLWNHRWEYDKDPDSFFRLLFRLQDEGIDFRLVVLGTSYGASPPIFEEARERLRDRIDHWGYATSAAEYARWLWRADLLPVTSRQDFFGISVVEAIYCNCLPLLPQRLAYPEHVPPKRFPECFYETEEELYAKLKKNLQHPATLRQLSPLRELVSRYDWRNLASVYDDLFMRLWMQKG